MIQCENWKVEIEMRSRKKKQKTRKSRLCICTRGICFQTETVNILVTLIILNGIKDLYTQTGHANARNQRGGGVGW